MSAPTTAARPKLRGQLPASLTSRDAQRNHAMRRHTAGARCILTLASGVQLTGRVVGKTSSPAGCVNVRTDKGNHYCLPYVKVEVLP